jgi:hypothetical protein
MASAKSRAAALCRPVPVGYRARRGSATGTRWRDTGVFRRGRPPWVSATRLKAAALQERATSRTIDRLALPCRKAEPRQLANTHETSPAAPKTERYAERGRGGFGQRLSYDLDQQHAPAAFPVGLYGGDHELLNRLQGSEQVSGTVPVRKRFLTLAPSRTH